MKQTRLLLGLLLFVFGISSVANSESKLRFYGGIGGTKVDVPAPLSKSSSLNLRAGAQILFQVLPNVSVGPDAAFLHTHSYNSGNNTFYNEYVHILGVAEFNYKWLILQAGMGPYIGVGDNDVVPFGFMFGGGFDLPVSKSISIPMMVKLDFIFESNTTIPISGLVGITIKLFD